jgi:hypothetical protein
MILAGNVIPHGPLERIVRQQRHTRLEDMTLYVLGAEIEAEAYVAKIKCASEAQRDRTTTGNTPASDVSYQPRNDERLC